MIDATSFIELMRKASHAGHNMLMYRKDKLVACYDLDIDDTIGYHYTLHVPESIQEKILDCNMILAPKKVVETFLIGDKAIKKHQKGVRDTLPLHIECTVELSGGKLIFKHYLLQKLIVSNEYILPMYPVKASSPFVSNIKHRYERRDELIDNDVPAVIHNVTTSTVVADVNNSNDITVYKMKIDGVKVKVPLTKATWLSVNKPTYNEFKIEATTIDDVYVFTHTMDYKSYRTVTWCYVHNY